MFYVLVVFFIYLIYYLSGLGGTAFLFVKDDEKEKERIFKVIKENMLSIMKNRNTWISFNLGVWLSSNFTILIFTILSSLVVWLPLKFILKVDLGFFNLFSNLVSISIVITSLLFFLNIINPKTSDDILNLIRKFLS